MGTLTRAFNRGDRREFAEDAEKVFPIEVRSAFPASSPRTLQLQALLSAVFLLLNLSSLAQSTHTTVRHHKVEDQDPVAALLTEAESNIEKENYAAAEAPLKK